MSLSRFYRLFDKTDERSLGDQVALLAEISHAFAASLDVHQTLQNALSQFMEHLHAEAASIFLLEQDGRELVCHGCAGPVDITGVRLSASKGIVGRAVAEMSCQIVRDVSREPDFAREVDLDTGFETHSILCAPLVVNGQCIGALELINKSEGLGLFGEQDRHLVVALASAAALAIRNARMADELLEQGRLRKEYEMTSEIQHRLLPALGTDDPSNADNPDPVQGLSSDFYDFFQRQDGMVYFSIGTVLGTGLNAALLMAKTSSLLHYLAKSIDDPGEYLARVNGEICEFGTDGMFIAMVAGMVNMDSGTISLVNAGHLPPLYQNHDESYARIPARAPPLGVEPDAGFPVDTVSLDVGSLYIFSAGPDQGNGGLEMADMVQLIQSRPNSSTVKRMQGISAEVRGYHDREHEYLSLVLIDDRS